MGCTDAVYLALMNDADTEKPMIVLQSGDVVFDQIGMQNGTTPEGNLTLGQKNALSKAVSYLEWSAFSQSGLADQLEYEGFTPEEAAYAARNCGADWNEQAAKKAASYLEWSSFSRQNLIEQLEYEGFTHEQAVYGVTACGY